MVEKGNGSCGGSLRPSLCTRQVTYEKRSLCAGQTSTTRCRETSSVSLPRTDADAAQHIKASVSALSVKKWNHLRTTTLNCYSISLHATQALQVRSGAKAPLNACDAARQRKGWKGAWFLHNMGSGGAYFKNFVPSIGVQYRLRLLCQILQHLAS